MKKILSSFLIVLSGISLTACSTMTNQDAGVLTGAVAGGLLGSTVGKGSGQVLAIAAGTVAGAIVGGSIGRSMDEADRMKMDRALENNSVGQPAYWHNSRTGAAYRVTPVRNVHYHGNPYCREYRTTADIGGRQQQIYGTACRQPDGSWKNVSR